MKKDGAVSLQRDQISSPYYLFTDVHLNSKSNSFKTLNVDWSSHQHTERKEAQQGLIPCSPAFFSQYKHPFFIYIYQYSIVYHICQIG